MKKGGESTIVSMIFTTVILIGLFATIISFFMRNTQKNYISDYLNNAVSQTCKNGMLTNEIELNLKRNLNKLFSENDYVLLYKYQLEDNIDDNIFYEVEVAETKMYVGDTFIIQFSLNIPETNATAEELNRQPLFSRIANIIVQPCYIDRMLQTHEGVIEVNAK